MTSPVTGARRMRFVAGLLLSTVLVGPLMMAAEPGAVSASLAADEDFATSTTVHPEIWPKTHSGVTRDPAMEAQITKLLSEMTLEEKVGQIMQADINQVTPAELKQYHLGSILNGGSSGPYGNDKAPAPDWLKLADEFYAASVDVKPGRPVIPMIWGMDAVHGNTNIIGATIFPHNIGLGAMNDPALMRQIGEITAKEIRIVGGDWTFAPTIAVVQNDRWGRTYESYSERPEIVTSYAKAIVEGIQGKPGDADFLKNDHVIATAKHFIGDGGTDRGHDQGDNLYTEKALRDIFGPPYEAAVEAGVQTVMSSFSSWRGHKMHGDKAFLTDILVDRMGFDGFVIGDWNGHAQPEGCNREDCPKALNAGLDMYMAPDGWKKLYANTMAEVKSGTIPMARLDEAVARVLRVKLRAGVMSEGKPSARPFAGQYDLIGSPQHRAVARAAVRESLVLLKNDNQILPLKPQAHVLVAGDGANDMMKQSGGWTVSWQGDGLTRADFPHATTVYEGIKANVEAAGGKADLSADGTFKTKPDVAIVVFGENPYAEFRGDRANVDYQPDGKTDLKLLQRLKEQGIPVVSVFISGRPLYVTPEINASNAFVAAWLPGGDGEGIADVLFAKADGTPAYDFKGRLSFSWPRSPEQTLLNIGTEPYYPLFAYGYGLSYAAAKNTGTLPEAVAGDVATANVDNFVEDGHAATSWAFSAYGAKGAKVAVDRPVVSAPGGALALSRVDRFKQEDTLKAVWNGRGKASLVLAGNDANFSHQLKENMAISLSLRVDDAPTGKVLLGMGAAAKLGHVDVTAALAKAKAKGWVNLQVRLSCLAKAGANMGAVSVPLEMVANGKFGVSLYSARLDAVTDAGACIGVTAQ